MEKKENTMYNKSSEASHLAYAREHQSNLEAILIKQINKMSNDTRLCIFVTIIERSVDNQYIEIEYDSHNEEIRCWSDHDTHLSVG